jgi:hypothetical protein
VVACDFSDVKKLTWSMNMEDKEAAEHAESHLTKAGADIRRAEEAEMLGDSARAEAAVESAEKEVKEALKEMKIAEEHHPKIHFEIQIDRKIFTVDLERMTGLQLRQLPSPPIDSNHDLFEVVPGGTDKKIGDNDVVVMKNGLRFFSAPAEINPGMELPTLGA